MSYRAGGSDPLVLTGVQVSDTETEQRKSVNIKTEYGDLIKMMMMYEPVLKTMRSSVGFPPRMPPYT